jgi:hypothetical protein
VEIVEVDEIPLTYVPNSATLIRVNAEGDLARPLDPGPENPTWIDLPLKPKASQGRKTLVLRQPWNQKGKGGEVWSGRPGC